ncbi:MAG: retron system putative HNH endonuclease [Verrucomicrobiota bacterium]
MSPNGPWFDGSIKAESDCRQETRKTLLINQSETCGWCQAKITLLASHSEHIKPKKNPAYTSLTFAMDNLIACCGNSTSSTCGHHKQEGVLANWIHPYHTANLEGFFTYEIDGEMKPVTRLSSNQQSEAFDAINTILNLNETVLRTKREKLISDLNGETYQDLSIDEIFTVVGEFKSLIEQYAP